MGNYFSGDRQIGDRTTPKKRKRISEDDDTNNLQKEREKKLLSTPRRKKLKTTSKYIYDTFFVNGTNSDVTITALNHQWKLHKVYLKQSGYFSSMLSGAWRESDQNDIDILIPDDNIDKEALDIAFGSLYQDDVSIKPCRVVSVLAAATLLQLDGLIGHCAETMEETVSAGTVCAYYQAALMYGLAQLARTCRLWLERNMMTTQTAALLKAVSAELLSEIVSSSDLFVMQVEMDVYSMLKKWVFLQLSPSWPGTNKQLGDAAESYMSNDDNKRALSEDETLLSVFRHVRLRHIINDVHSANILLTDGLIPKSWLRPVYCSQWHQMLAIEQGVDKGPNDQLDHDLFLKESLRCGRVLHNDGEYCWRWTGYNYGTDLLVTYAHRLIIVKRNTQTHSYPLSVSLEPKRSVMLRCTVVSFDQSGRPKYSKCSGIMTLSLGKEGEAIILSVDRQAKFPLHVSMNLLFYTPDTRLKDVCEPPADQQTLTGSRSSQRSRSSQGSKCDEASDSTSKPSLDYGSSSDPSSRSRLDQPSGSGSRSDQNCTSSRRTRSKTKETSSNSMSDSNNEQDESSHDESDDDGAPSGGEELNQSNESNEPGCEAGANLSEDET